MYVLVDENCYLKLLQDCFDLTWASCHNDAIDKERR